MPPVLVPVVIVLVLVMLPLIYAIANYNVLVRLRQHCRESWSGIDTELRRRYDLIGNLVETVKGYATHEREVFEAVTEARSRAIASDGSPKSQARDENALVGTLKTLFAVSESYPELKASENFLALQTELANTEDRIQAARRFYNANVRDINTRVEVFPSNIIAGMFHFSQEEYFEIDSADIRIPPKVNL